MNRESGILMPVASLPSRFGIGGFGKESYHFVDLSCLLQQKKKKSKESLVSIGLFLTF